MNRRQVFLNAVTTSIQVLASAAILFFLYRFLIRALGMERLGIWSLVLATTSVVALAHQGFATGIVKYVAKYAARNSDSEVSLLIQTAILSAAVCIAAVALALYPAACWVLGLVVPRSALPEAIAILPCALVSLWCNVMQAILQAGLAGHQWITLCNYLELGGSLAYLLLAFALVPAHGLMGIALAQALQAAAFVALTWFILRRKLSRLPLLPRRWDRGLFREIAAYGLHFQFITACQSLREPVTKALIAKFGGLAMTGFYDLASRCVVTCRELIVQANQVLIPAVSHLQETDRESLPGLYRDSYRLVFFLAVPSFAAIAVLAPFVSRVWIGYYEPIFVEFVAMLVLAWLLNVLANPAYVFDLGTGALRPVTISCASTAILNAGLGLIAGHSFGGIAVVAVSALSLAGGYVFIHLAYLRNNRIPFAVLLPAESRSLLMFSAPCAIILCAMLFSRADRFSASPVLSAAIILAVCLLLVSMWRHPLRRRLIRWAFSRTTARAEAL